LFEEDTEKIRVKVPKEEIVFMDMVFKSYEGLASLTIKEHETGIINLEVTQGTKEDVLAILNDFKQQFPLKILKK